MSRKTTSEPDNQVTLFSELRKEFTVYFTRFSHGGSRFIGRYPRQVFTAMLVCMITSAVLAFSVMRQQKVSVRLETGSAASGVTTGLGQILGTSAALREILELQNRISTILKKDTLDQTDSLVLRQAFQRLESIHQQLKTKP